MQDKIVLKQLRAVTLLEILIVVVIIGVLAALALPNFAQMREGALNREAMANLKLLQAAERIYRMEISVFYTSAANPTHTQDLSEQLRLDLSARHWRYRAWGGPPLDVRGTRVLPDTSSFNRVYYIDEDEEVACCCNVAPDTSCPSQDLCTNHGQSCPPVW